MRTQSPEQKPGKARKSLKAQFYYIRRLIQQERYNDARYLLLQIEHPKADEWLEKLNRLDPNYSETTIILLKPLLLIVIVFCLGMMLLSAMGRIETGVALGVSGFVLLFYMLLMSLYSRHW